jgi:hypothetical protein
VEMGRSARTLPLFVGSMPGGIGASRVSRSLRDSGAPLCRKTPKCPLDGA